MIALPSMKGLPLLGNLLEYRNHKIEFLTKMRDHHGDQVLFRLGKHPLVLITHPDDIQWIEAKNCKNYVKATNLRELIGDGIFMSEGEKWRKQRRLIQPTFHQSNILKMIETMNRRIKSYLLTLNPGEFQPAFGVKKMVFEIVGEALFGDELGKDFNELRHSMEFLNRFLTSRFSQFIPVPLGIPTPSHLKFRKVRRVLENTVGEIIAKKQKQIAAGIVQDDIVTKMIMARDPETGEAMSSIQLCDESISLLIAGYETTGHLLEWMLHLLATHPDVQRELIFEIDAKIGDRVPSGEDTFQLQVLSNIVEETLRLYPSVWAWTKRSVQEDELRGRRFPAGSIFYLSAYLMHRHPQYWSEPDRFIPSRWNAELREKNKQVYFPFGMGPRTCVGKHFALMEIKLFLIQFFQRYEIQPNPEQIVEPSFQLTIGMKNPLSLILQRRSG
jgi:cytochrome P450